MSTVFGDKLKALRAGRDWTQQELALRSGIKRGYLASIEVGLVANPSANVFLKLSTAFNIPLEELYEAAGYVKNINTIQRRAETAEDIIEHLKAIQPASISLYNWEDYPFEAGRYPVPVDYIFRAKRYAIGRKLEAYRISGTQWEPMVSDRDLVIIDREGEMDTGKVIACRLNGMPTLGKLRKIDDTLYIETDNRRTKFDDCQMPAPVIEIRRYFIQRQ
ncbi:MAG: helix-turn-helix domain-containing protein [Dehalococcoidales bacterium]|nr:helix-turn-helix domain-containing protein [Dehalococcoidales bacterium]